MYAKMAVVPCNPENAIAMPKITPIICLNTKRMSVIYYLVSSPCVENAFVSRLVLLSEVDIDYLILLIKLIAKLFSFTLSLLVIFLASSVIIIHSC